LLKLIVILIAAVSGWITTLQMRRRARKALGRPINDSELTSINTWMKVAEAEKRRPLGD
jgi:hypothetical protein